MRILAPLLLLWSGLLCAAEPVLSTDGSERSEEDVELPSGIEARLRQETSVADNPFVILPHRPSYLLPLSYNRRPNLSNGVLSDGALDKTEIKFQFSFKLPVWKRPLGDNSVLFFAYTQQSYWQAYNGAVSSPFRETNHEPELILSFLTDYPVLGMRNRVVSFGLNHQSNGQSEALSRSWNRFYAQFVLERGSFALSFKSWLRFSESASEDDNPDIEEFMGHGELAGLYRLGDQRLGWMLRGSTRHNHGALQVDWTFPISSRAKGYVQYFEGYGESLIDYDHHNQRLSVGMLLADWL